MTRQQRRKLAREKAKKSNSKNDSANNPMEKMAELLARAEDPNDSDVSNMVLTNMFSENGEDEEITATELAKKLDEKTTDSE